MIYDYIVIGAGASGLMLAAQLNIKEQHKTGIILEGSSKPGSKILMSGGGHCNITHEGSIKEFIAAYGDAGRSMRKCLYKHNNEDLISWLNEGGIPTTINEEGKVFPASMRSADILSFLLDKTRANGWELKTSTKVTGLKPLDLEEAEVWSVSAREVETGRTAALTAAERKVETGKPVSYAGRTAIIACGGSTYPETGSDGSMFALLKELGIDMEPFSSALAPLNIRDYPYSELSGISLSDVTVTAYGTGMNTCKGKAARMTGDLLFTHTGFSGPVILNISQYAEAGEPIRIQYNKKIDELPKRLRKALEDRSRGPSGDIRTNKLASLLEGDTLTVKSIDPRGMVSKGGILLSEIDTGTMQVKLGHGPELFAAGEVLDATGITGGYNLQLCYSTACAIADYLRSR